MEFCQRENIGFEYIKSKMLPATPFGTELIKNITPFGRGEKDLLNEELENLNKLYQKYDTVKSDVNAIRRIFMQIKDVRGSVKFGRDNTLSDIDLFEIKTLLMHMEKLKPLIERVSGEIGLTGFNIESVSEAVDILDPDKRRIPTFAIYDDYSDELKAIRRKKHEIEIKMQESNTAFEELKEKRLAATVEEEREERKIREVLSANLRPYFDNIIKNIDVIGRFDLLLEKYRAAKLYPSCLPKITEDILILEDTINPYICDILELCGFFVYANVASIPLFDEIVIISEESQSVDKGLSSFGAQIVELKNLLNEIEGKYIFAILDEFARGTNPKEGENIVRGLVALLNKKRAISFLVTHFDHVAELSGSHYQVRGLQGASEDKIAKALLTKSSDDAKITAIAQFMNYGIFKVKKQAQPPKEALMICRLLGLQEELMDILREIN